MSTRGSLLQRSVLIFGLLALLLPLFFKLSSLLLPPIGSGKHEDKLALEALRTLESALRPVGLVTRRIGNVEDLADAISCPEEAKHHLYASLEKIEDRLMRMAGVDDNGNVLGNRRLPEYLVVDAAAWKSALQGRTVACKDLQRGLALLAKNDGAALESLEWRGLTHGKLPEGQWMRIPELAFARSNPWGGLPGCILLDEGMNRWYVSNGRNDYCVEALTGTQPTAKRQPVASTSVKGDVWQLPDSLNTILAELDQVRLPSASVYREVTRKEVHGPNLVQLEGHEREAGFNVSLTLNPSAQHIAQQTARCYAGNREACKVLGLSESEIGKMGAEFYEHAAVRMTGVAIVDVASGKIEALASAHTECYRQQYDGPGRDNHCPDLTRSPRFNPDMLLNHALFSDAMPASTIKPILALGFLETPGYTVDQAELTRQLQVSDSPGFLDRLFCLDSGDAENCHRIAQAQKAASQLGWNPGCIRGGMDCGFGEVLFGRPATERLDTAHGKLHPLGLRILHGRLFTQSEEAGKMVQMPESALQFDPNDAMRCQKQKWGNCIGNPVATPAAEGWGQGSARATPLGVAGMLARLGAAAQNAKVLRRPYLIREISDIQGKPLALSGFMPGQAEELNIPDGLALRVVEGLRQGHVKGGTAYSACQNAGIVDCNAVNWVAGKTGTPPFGFDDIKLEDAVKKCTDDASDPKVIKRCREIPYKWYAALFQSGAKGSGFDKAIAVLSERNWHESGKLKGYVDAQDDSVNRSAEIAFRIMGKFRAEAVSRTK